jgi:site-specific recombinase XerD
MSEIPRDRLGRNYTSAQMSETRLGRAPANKGLTYPAELFTAVEVSALLATCSRRGKAGARNRAMFVTQWRTGVRCQELLDLLPRDVDLDARTLLVRHGKGNKRRALGLDDQTVVVIERWLAVRAGLGISRSAPLFCTISTGKYQRAGRRLGYTTYRDSLQRAGARAGIEKRVHTHGLRHTFATDCLHEGISIPVISDLLGHNDLATTVRYLHRLSNHEAVTAAQVRVWPDQAAAAAQLPVTRPLQLNLVDELSRLAS